MHIHSPFKGQLEAMWPYPKHLKHFLLDNLIGDIWVEVEGLDSLGLKEESLEGRFEKVFYFSKNCCSSHHWESF